MIRHATLSAPRPEFAPANLSASSASAVLSWSEDAIRFHAARRGPKMSAVALCAKQLFRETVLRYAKHINFRTTENAQACAAYSAMSVAEFADVNRRQAWANWRTIPRNLSGRLPNAPLSIIDLCCGTGDSTEVLAFYAAPGSRIVGLEWSEAFVRAARRREFHDRHHRRASVRFHRQSVLDTFCTEPGRAVRDASIDLVNASGAVGCHFDADEVFTLAEECARVVKLGGLALVDSGTDEMPRSVLKRIFEDVGFRTIGAARSCMLDRRRQLCLRRVS
ncbi:MAG: class I SAM-dependent methyltransferase [Planctomycetaceae bacterium]|nr:class I SAM-dependent methyltransferase [Planctomycetaceae bacterium]